MTEISISRLFASVASSPPHVNPSSFAVRGTLILRITLIFAKKGYSPPRLSRQFSPSPQSSIRPSRPIASSPPHVNPSSFAVRGTLILPITLIFAKKGYSPQSPLRPLASVTSSPPRLSCLFAVPNSSKLCFRCQ
jgi:hypothetical protein